MALRKLVGPLVPRTIKRRLGNSIILTKKILTNLAGRIFFSNCLRMAMYRWAGMDIGSGAIVWAGNRVNHADKISVGSNSILGPCNVVLSQGGVFIGSEVNISGFSFIISQAHDAKRPDFTTILAPIFIEDYVWIATNVTILSGVRIGRGAIVAAGSVVTRDVPPLTIVAGNPARSIGTRSSDFRYSTRDNKGLKWL